MASKEAVTNMIMMIKTLYPYFAKDIDKTVLYENWKVFFSDVGDKELAYAFKKAVEVCVSPPTVADIKKQIRKRAMSSLPSAEELWIKYRNALEKTSRLKSEFKYTYEENGITQGEKARAEVKNLYEGLDEVLKKYLGDDRELIAKSDKRGEALDWEKKNMVKFVKDYYSEIECGMVPMLKSGMKETLCEADADGD